MSDSEALALVDSAENAIAAAHIDTPPLDEDTVAIDRLLRTNRREISLVPPTDLTDQRARALAAKLSLPHQGFVLSRERLRKAIEPVRGGGIVGLVAGPGCGKTAFIVDLLRSSESRTIYFSLDEGDRDPIRFLTYLMAGLGMDQARTSAEAASWPCGAAAEVVALDLAAELMDFISSEAGRPTLIAIDDFHLVDVSSDVVHIVNLIARGLPPGWIMLVSSRRPLPFEIEPVGLGGRSILLEARDLRLTPREVSRWAAQNWGLTLEPSESRALWRTSEGWPAALVLLGQQLVSRGGATHADLVGIMSRGRDLRSYLERHILTGLDALTAEVMLAGALLPRVIFPRDEPYLPGGPGAAESALEQLVARGFLVTRSGRRAYTVHPLVRAFAERQAWASDEGLVGVSRAAGHLERIGEYHRAAYLYLRAGRFDDAARPLRALALSSLNAVADFAHEGWADLLPENEDGSPNAWLLVAKARMLQQQAKYSAAGTLYEAAARALAAAGDNEGLLLVLLGSVFCLFNQGRWDESLAVVKRCRSIAKLPEEKVEVLVVEGNILVSLCRWDEAAEDYERALALAPSVGRDAMTRRIALHRSRLFYTLGHHRLAEQWAEKAAGRAAGAGAATPAGSAGASAAGRSPAGRAPGGRTPTQAMALNSLATVAVLLGEYPEAGRFADECVEMVRSRGYTFLEIPALMNQAAVAQGRWDYRAAVRLMREAQALAAEAGDTEGSFRAEDMLGDLCRRNRNARRALEHHRAALDIVDKSRLATSERVRALTGIGADMVVLGQTNEAQAALEETVRLSRRWNLKGSLAPSLLYLGWLHACHSREHDAARCLIEAMHIAEEHGHVHFFAQEAKVAVPILALCDRLEAGGFLRRQVLPLLPRALARQFEEMAKGRTYPTDVSLGSTPARRIVSALPEAASGQSADPAAMEGIESLTDREREVLKMVALGMSNKQIGSKLYISEKTVKTHANHIFHKLGVASRIQATLAFQSYQRARRAGGAGRRPPA